ncbi:COMM domain-containing protein 4-like, partial [Macaca nemestrina]|uniref:COMM domain-containing protein 4-like n=1 Tax=Macaca nemestrina TaxID=9545 RepID=UPI0039B8A0E8
PHATGKRNFRALASWRDDEAPGSSVKLQLLCSQYEKILKLTADVKFESSDMEDTVAVLSFILSSAAKHSVDGKSLASELQQLGLPKEHAASLCHCYEEKQSPLQKHLWIYSLRSNPKVQSFGVQEGRSPWLCDLGLVPGSLWL